MKKITLFLFITICCIPFVSSQQLAEAKELYLAGEYPKALPVFEAEYQKKTSDAQLNQWYGVCLFKTGTNIAKAEECLKIAAKKRIRDAFLYLGDLYTQQYQFDNAEESLGKFEAMLKKRGDDDARTKLEESKKITSRLRRMVENTEDIQIIDSLVIDKKSFLNAYKLSLSSGHLEYFNQVFNTNIAVKSTVYFNEKETKIYYGQPLPNGEYSLFSMEKLLDKFGNEKPLSPDNFGLDGSVNYPYMMADGVTIYFAANDAESIGGYDLFVSRYNLNNDTYLTPERLNMPFNSIYNDYLMAVDEEKGVGWFASDRFQPEGKVCVYTFIPNKSVKQVESEDVQYKSSRALITSIKDSWKQGANYAETIKIARKEPVIKQKTLKDFDFVIDDNHTYYVLADFKNKTAKDIYFKVVQMRSDLKLIETDLNNQRESFSKASPTQQEQIKNSILGLEEKLKKMVEDIQNMEIQARNKEIESFTQN